MVFNKNQIGSAVQLQDIRFDTKADCIITKVEKNEILVMYYEKETEEIAYKTLTKEDLILDDYKLKLLYYSNFRREVITLDLLKDAKKKSGFGWKMI